MTSKVDYALQYVKLGCAVLPLQFVDNKGRCSCGKKAGECSAGKHPLNIGPFKEGYKDATVDIEVIKKAWSMRPQANIGWTLGKIIVVDQDNRHGGEEALKKLEAKYGLLPPTVTVLTGSGDGSRHRYYMSPNGGTPLCNICKIDGLDGLELKALGYAVGVGSVTAKSYVWAPGASPDDIAIVPMPDWLVEISHKPFVDNEAKKETPRPDYPPLTDSQNIKALDQLLGDCAFIKHCAREAPTLPEPEWQAMIQILVYLGEPGIVKIHQLSKPYPTYNEAETQKKIEAALKAINKKGLGPYTCQKIEQNLGFKCPTDCVSRGLGTRTPVTAAIKKTTKRESPPLEYSEEEKRPKVRRDLIGLTPQNVKDICSKGFLRAYLDWASRYTDAPLAFHLAVALSLIATSMGNKVKARAWGRDLYPNLWIVILSPTGFFRKTTCIRLGMRILKKELGDLVLPSEWSREKLIGLLAKTPAGLFEWDEFGSALAMMSKDYMVGTRETLTKLFDSMDTHSRVTGQGGQSGTIENPAPNIVGGSTIEWLSERVKEGDLRGGFMSRFLFIPGTQKEPEKDFHEAYQPYLESELGTALSHISKLNCEVDFKPVHSLIKDWVRVHEDTSTEIAPELMGFVSRGETYLLKLLMVIGAASYPETGEIEISEGTFERAAELLDCIKDGVSATVAELAIPKEGKELDKMREMLKRYCPQTKREALQRSRLKARTFDGLFNTLLQTGEIAIENQKTTKGQTMQMVAWRGD